MNKKEKICYFIFAIVLILCIVWLVKVTIPYYQADIQSKQAIIEMSRRCNNDN